MKRHSWQKSLGLFLVILSIELPAEAASRRAVYGRQGMVVSTSRQASEIGAEVLRQGGNAVDAAVAVGFALAVTWPSAGNIGGGGFALVRTPNGEAKFIDYREVAPLATHEKFYQNSDGSIIPEASTIGFKAAGVPGTPAGLEWMHKRWGRLPWAKLVAPARRLAGDGYRLDRIQAEELNLHSELLFRFPETKKIFFPQNRLLIEGDLLIQKDLAQSLAILEKEGSRAFYSGALAKKLVTAMGKEGGVMTPKDFLEYKVEERTPIAKEWKGYQVLTAPPPSSGGATLLQIMGTLEKDDLKHIGFGSALYVHMLVESMKRAFADRAEWYGDPKFVDVPLEHLLKGAYLQDRRSQILTDKATPSAVIKTALRLPEETKETTHFTIMDKEGMVVSNTYTLNGSFGSGAVAKGTGILMNNEMDDFTSKAGVPNMYGLIQGSKNAIVAKKRPLSSMTPTIFVKDGVPVLAVGSPGGPTIINTVLQVSLNVLVHGFGVQEAVDAPRIHHQWLPDQIKWEPRGLNPDSMTILERMGHVFAKEPRFIGDAQAITYDPMRKEWAGGSDSRLGGVAVAP